MTESKYPALLDADNAMIHLRAVVAKFGADYRYTLPAGRSVCVYVHGDAEALVPGCIVAQVLHRHGVPMDVLCEYEGLGPVQMADEGSLVRRGLKVLLTERAGVVLASAQWMQDGFRTWGRALAEAEAAYANRQKVVAA